jgi:CRISPR system Cascade subunit CasA
LTDGIADNPIVAVASPRPDFDGALTQFLIGLLQTTCTPGEDQWWDWRESPPAPDVLKERFEPLLPAFQLTSEKGALFMQERLGDKAEEHPVTYLLIGAATDSALKNNTDHFQKRPQGGECLCRFCAAAALYTLQTFAPSGGGGGDGKFTSLRGGGPLTTLVMGGNLWETVWLNVIYGDTFPNGTPDHTIFPWLKSEAFITDAAPVKTIHSTAMKPEHVFWGMPRRIQLNFTVSSTPSDAISACAVCGLIDESACVGFHDLTGGLTYQEEYTELGRDGKEKKKKRPSWISPSHPLSPHTTGRENRPLAAHPQPGGIGYRHWLGLIENSKEGDSERRPARVVEQFRITGKDAQLWAYGFDMDNMKARCWYDATMPILAIPKEHEALFSDGVTRMVVSAQKVEGDVRKYLKVALFPEKSKVRTDELGFGGSFWDETDTAFYVHLRSLRSVVPTDPLAQAVLESWLGVLNAAALIIFDRYSGSSNLDVMNPRRIARARNDLGMALNGMPLRKLLGLPKPARKKP